MVQQNQDLNVGSESPAQLATPPYCLPMGCLSTEWDVCPQNEVQSLSLGIQGCRRPGPNWLLWPLPVLRYSELLGVPRAAFWLTGIACPGCSASRQTSFRA